MKTSLTTTVVKRLPLMAVILGTTLAMAGTIKKSVKRYDSHYFVLTNESQPLLGSSYTEVPFDDYQDISCSGSTKTCKLESSSATLPTTMADTNSDNIPDVAGSVVSVSRKD